MPLRLEFMVANSYLKRKSSQHTTIILSILGVALGVAVLISVNSVIKGLHGDLIGRITSVSGHVKITETPNKLTHYQSTIDQIIQDDQFNQQVTRIVPMIEGHSIASHNNFLSAALIRGITAADLAHEKAHSSIVLGSLEGFIQGKGVVMGSRMAKTLGVTVGDDVGLLYRSKQAFESLVGTLPRTKTFTVSAIFNIGMYDHDRSLIYIPLASAQQLFRYGEDEVSVIEMYLRDPMEAEAAVNWLSNQTSHIVYSWKEEQKYYLDALRTEKTATFMVLAFVIIMASFNIVSSLNVLVHNKKTDIAILRTMGATKASVMKIFLMSGLMIGGCGATLGMLIGIPLASNIGVIYDRLASALGIKLVDISAYSDKGLLPSKLLLADVGWIALITVTLSFVATIYPALRAAKQEPADTLRLMT